MKVPVQDFPRATRLSANVKVASVSDAGDAFEIRDCRSRIQITSIPKAYGTVMGDGFRRIPETAFATIANNRMLPPANV